MSKATRLVGIDLCRGLAAFAVILVHSGDETWGLPISSQAIEFRYLFYYAVPFFLAASFYFGTKKSSLKIDRKFWQKKLQRIVVPYLLWSMFYVFTKIVLFTLSQDGDRLQELLADPLAIVFLGAASYHLYFIPLLLAGTVLLYFTSYLKNRDNSLVLLSLFSIISIALYQLLMFSKNDFNLDSYTAFPSLLSLIAPNNLLYQPWRIILVNLAWITRCLPYFCIALLIHQVLDKNDCKWLYERETAVALFLLFLLIDITGKIYLPASVNEIAIAYSFLLFGMAVSPYISFNNLIANLGLCSFGIYLIHPIVKSAIEIIIIMVLPQATKSVSIFSMSIYSVSSFLISWSLIYLMQKNKLVSQYI